MLSIGIGQLGTDPGHRFEFASVGDVAEYTWICTFSCFSSTLCHMGYESGTLG